MSSYHDGVFFLKRADSNFNMNEFEKAAELYTQSIKYLDGFNGPQMFYELPRAYTGRATCYRAMNKHEEAIADLDDALNYNRDSALGWAMRGASYAEIGNFEKSIEDLSIAIELDPKFYWSIASRGYTHYLAWEFDKAEIDLKKIPDSDENYHWAVSKLHEIVTYKKRYNKSIEKFKKSVDAIGDIFLELDKIGPIKITHRLIGHEGKILDIKISSDGSFAVSGDVDGKIIIWNIKEKKKSFEFQSDDTPIRQLKLSCNNRFLISFSDNGIIYIWDLRDQEQIQAIEDFHPKKVRVSQNGKYACATGYREILILNLQSSETNKFVSSSIHKFTIEDSFISNDGQNLYILYRSDLSNFHFSLFDISTGNEIRNFFSVDATTLRINFSRDKRYFITNIANHTGYTVPTETKDILSIWDEKTGKSKQILEYDEPFQYAGSIIYEATLSDEGEFVLSFCGSYNISLFDVNKPRVRLFYKPSDVNCLDISPNRDYALLGGENSLYFWNLAEIFSK